MAAASCGRLAAASSPWRTPTRDSWRLLSRAQAPRAGPGCLSGFGNRLGDRPADTFEALSRRRPAPLSSNTCSMSGARPYSTSVPATTAAAAASASSSSSPRFSYHIAASFIAKDRPYDPSTHVFHFNPYNRIQPPRNRRRSSRPDSGHDAFFVSRVIESGAVAFGVADGVGGWVDSGVDPADFSHGLCDYMAAAAYEHQSAGDNNGSPPPLTARRLMQQGYDAVCRDRNVPAGGSTACVAIAGPDGVLDVANLGDSGFLHLRLNAVHAYSESQTHAFNTPYQLSVIPPAVAARMAAFGGAQLCDMPRDADVTQHSVRHGDILVFATDGVFDNLFNQDILRIASRVMVGSGAWNMAAAGGVSVADSLHALTRPNASNTSSSSSSSCGTATTGMADKVVTLQSLLATELVLAAKRASVNTKKNGPFAKEVKRYFPLDNWHGGKIDDICLVVAVVAEDDAASGVKSKL